MHLNASLLPPLPTVQASLRRFHPILLLYACNPSSINQTHRKRAREELENGSSNWMRDLLRVSPVLYLIFHSDLFFED